MFNLINDLIQCIMIRNTAIFFVFVKTVSLVKNLSLICQRLIRQITATDSRLPSVNTSVYEIRLPINPLLGIINPVNIPLGKSLCFLQTVKPLPAQFLFLNSFEQIQRPAESLRFFYDFCSDSAMRKMSIEVTLSVIPRGFSP